MIGCLMDTAVSEKIRKKMVTSENKAHSPQLLDQVRQSFLPNTVPIGVPIHMGQRPHKITPWAMMLRAIKIIKKRERFT